MTHQNPLRDLPSVQEVLEHVSSGWPHELALKETRWVIDEMRLRLLNGSSVDTRDTHLLVERNLERLNTPSLRRVINATGVILHTNLGRAPLPAAEDISGYSNLEYDLEAGRRGRRDDHVEPLLKHLLGAPAIAVNNNAAAVWLVLNELAAGAEVVISRGELIEIGDGFRIPEIMTRSGVVLREIGTTNRTTTEDYRAAINERTRLLMRVHPSNFHITGFTGRPSLQDLAALAKERGLPLYEDLGSGCLVDLKTFGVQEPLVADSLRTGASIVSFSGDKLLGGPQAGFIAGNYDLVSRCRRSPMYRAFRLDKLVLSSMESALRNILFERYDRIPALRMIMMPAEQIQERASRMLPQLTGFEVEIRSGESLIGGGTTPDGSLPTYVLALRHGRLNELERRLRMGAPPVVARIEKDALLIDLRTVAEDDDEVLGACLLGCCNE